MNSADHFAEALGLKSGDPRAAALGNAFDAAIVAQLFTYDDSDTVAAALAKTLPEGVLVVKTDAGPDDCPVQAAPHRGKRRTSNPPKPKTKGRSAPKPATSPGNAQKRRPPPAEPVDDDEEPEPIPALDLPKLDLTELRNVALKRGLSIDAEGGDRFLLRYGRPSRKEVHRGTLASIADYLDHGERPVDEADDVRIRLRSYGYTLHLVEPGLYSVAMGQLEIYRGDIEAVRSFCHARIFGRPPDPRFNDYRKDL